MVASSSRRKRLLYDRWIFSDSMAFKDGMSCLLSDIKYFYILSEAVTFARQFSSVSSHVSSEPVASHESSAELYEN